MNVTCFNIHFVNKQFIRNNINITVLYYKIYNGNHYFITTSKWQMKVITLPDNQFMFLNL